MLECAIARRAFQCHMLIDQLASKEGIFDMKVKQTGGEKRGKGLQRVWSMFILKNGCMCENVYSVFVLVLTHQRCRVR